MMRAGSLKIDKTMGLFIVLLLLVLDNIVKTSLGTIICLGVMIPLEAQNIH